MNSSLKTDMTGGNHCHSGKKNHQIVSKGLVAIFLQPPWLAENKIFFDFQGLQMQTQSPAINLIGKLATARMLL